MPCDCPPNGLTDVNAWCFEHVRTDGDERWYCTRIVGHDGPHSACIPSDHPAHVWGREEVAA